MLQFLKENWLWIALPIVLALVVLVFLLNSHLGDDVAPFTYDV